MLRTLNILLLALVAVVTVAAQGPVAAPKTHLKVGDTAPDFTLNSTAGKPVKLSDYRGKKNVAVSFFPAAFTAG